MRGLRLLATPTFSDDRGRFLVAWRLDDLAALEGFSPFVQESLSESHQGVLRGLHFQRRHPQGKLVRVVHGEIYDVAVDLRPDSPSRHRWQAQVLSATRAEALWIPPGFAHGFYTLSPLAVVLYQVTAPWDPDDEGVIRYDDPAIGIEWPLPPDAPPRLSPRDARAPWLDPR